MVREMATAAPNDQEITARMDSLRVHLTGTEAENTFLMDRVIQIGAQGMHVLEDADTLLRVGMGSDEWSLLVQRSLLRGGWTRNFLYDSYYMGNAGAILVKICEWNGGWVAVHINQGGWRCSHIPLHFDAREVVMQASDQHAVIVQVKKQRIIDSGSTTHVNSDTTNTLSNFVRQDEGILLADENVSITSSGRGDDMHGKLKKSMHCPTMTYSLVSPSVMDKDNQFTILCGGRACIYSAAAAKDIVAFVDSIDEHAIIRAIKKKGLYVVQEESEECLPVIGLDCEEEGIDNGQAVGRGTPWTTSTPKLLHGSFGTERPGANYGMNDLERLHKTLGHIPKNAILHMLRNNSIVGANITYQQARMLDMRPCDSCYVGKLRSDSVPGSRFVADLAPFEKVSWDPVDMGVISRQGNKWANIGCDYESGIGWLIAAKTCGEQKKVLDKFITQVVGPYKLKTRQLVTDAHSVFEEKDFQATLIQLGIVHRPTVPYLHHGNRVERYIRTVMEAVRVTLADAGLPKSYWEYAMQWVIMIRNVIPVANAVQTPEEKASGLLPDISGFRPFGCRVYYHIKDEEFQPTEMKKWQMRAKRGILVGMSGVTKGAYLIYPGKNAKVLVRQHVVVMTGKEADMLPPFSNAVDGLVPFSREAAVATITQPVAERTRGRDRSLHCRYISVESHAARDCACLVHRTDQSALQQYSAPLPSVPKNIDEALAGEDRVAWAEAFQDHVREFQKYGLLCDFDRNKVPVGACITRPVCAFRVNYNGDGTVKYKFRVANDGSKQREGVHFQDKYSPTVQHKSVMVVLHWIAMYDWNTLCGDIGSAYLEAESDMELYMHMPKNLIQLGFCKTSFVKVMHNMFGSKPAGREWHTHIRKILEEFGMSCCYSDTCLFYKFSADHEILLMVLYVDDFILTGNWDAEASLLWKLFENKFKKVKDLGELTKFLGMEICRNRDARTIELRLDNYIAAVVREYVPDHVKAASVPLSSALSYRLLTNGEEAPIWQLGGKIRFIADKLAPQLKVAANIISSAGAHPSIEHHAAAKSVLKYIKGMHGSHFVTLGGKGIYQPAIYCDGSYNPGEDSKSFYSVMISLSRSSGVVIAKVKKMSEVAHCSAQPEIKAMSEGCKEEEWLEGLHQELHMYWPGGTPVFTDSQSSIDLVSNVFGNYPKCKTFNRDINYVRQRKQCGKIIPYKINTLENFSDIGTKVLPRGPYERFSARCNGGYDAVPDLKTD